MRRQKTSCDYRALSLLSDQELAPCEIARLRKHLRGCPSCRQRLRDLDAVSGVLNRIIQDESLRAGLEEVEENVVALIRRQRLPRWKRMADFLMSQKFYVPASVVTTALLLFFAFSEPNGSVSGPSAHISYVGGDLESVVILQTEKSHRTVVWFNETGGAGEEERGVHKERSNARTPSGKQHLIT